MFIQCGQCIPFHGTFFNSVNVLSQSAWGAVRQYMFGVIPLFVLMGLLANLSGASQDLYDSASLLLKKVRGGVGIATVIANAIFAAITGVTVASAAVFTKIALPQMLRLKYNRKIALGTISGSAILGMLIPPSLLMIVYGSQADVSIGKLFVAAVMPGILMTIAFIIVILTVAHIKPDYIPEVEELTEYEKENFWKIVLRPWPIVLLIIISLGGIWCGFFTPTEAGGVGAFGAFLIVIFRKRFNRKEFWETAFIGRFNLRQRPDSSGIGIHIFQDVVHVRCHQCTPGSGRRFQHPADRNRFIIYPDSDGTGMYPGFYFDSAFNDASDVPDYGRFRL